MTSIGRFIRRYSMNDLPQLINVLRGEMSLVRSLGFGDPAITGLWQVNGRSELSFKRWYYSICSTHARRCCWPLGLSLGPFKSDLTRASRKARLSLDNNYVDAPGWQLHNCLLVPGGLRCGQGACRPVAGFCQVILRAPIAPLLDG
jgi:lipopolysaccharide/colanic/teichoic acid biosynthesis glycosyltransferase